VSGQDGNMIVSMEVTWMGSGRHMSGNDRWNRKKRDMICEEMASGGQVLAREKAVGGLLGGGVIWWGRSDMDCAL
jgi:hypothetical protein